MSLTAKEISLIQKALDKELSAEERQEVSELKQVSESFREELQLQKAIVSALKAKEKAAKIAFVRNLVLSDDAVEGIDEEPGVRKSGSEKEKAPVRFTGTYLKIAATITLLLISALAIVFLMGNNKSPEELYADYYEPLDATISTRSDTDTKISDPLKVYGEGDYASAVEVLKQAINQPEAPIALQVYLALSLLETNREDEAISIFERLRKEYPYDFVGQHAAWYLALIDLQKDAGSAQKQFEAIVNQGGIYESQARKLLEEM